MWAPRSAWLSVALRDRGTEDCAVPRPAQLDSPKNTQGGAAVQDACRAGCVPTASPAGSVRCDGGRGTRGAGEAAFSEGSDLRRPLNPLPPPPCALGPAWTPHRVQGF